MLGFPYADHPPADDDPSECECVECGHLHPSPMSGTGMRRLAEALARFDALTTREQLWRQGAARD
jgi:hypothetical protein